MTPSNNPTYKITIPESEKTRVCQECNCNVTEKSDYFVEKYGLIHKMRLCIDCRYLVESFETFKIISVEPLN